MDRHKRYRPHVKNRTRNRERDYRSTARIHGPYPPPCDADNRKRSSAGDIPVDINAGGDAEPLLPAHVQDLILDRLPARQRCRIRQVCKAWNVLPAAAAQQRELWFLMVRPPRSDRSCRFRRHLRKRDVSVKWRFRAYSSCCLGAGEGPGENPFFRLPLPNPHHSRLSSLLGLTSGGAVSRLAHIYQGKHPYADALFLRSAGGLMSAIVRRPRAVDCYDFIVFNCLTGCVKVLPPLVNPSKVCMIGSTMGGFLHMTLDGQDPSRYYILFVSLGDHYEVYDSERAGWNLIRNPRKSSMRNFVATHSSSELSVVDADFWWFKYVGHCLLGYHARHDAWTGLLLPWIPRELGDRRGNGLIVRYEGRLLVGEIMLGADKAIFGFRLWELQCTSLQTGTWVEVAKTPEHLYPRNVSFMNYKVELLADGGIFCMALLAKGTGRSVMPRLVFDMARDSWYSLPFTRTSRKFGCIFLHRPSFSASV